MSMRYPFPARPSRRLAHGERGTIFVLVLVVAMGLVAVTLYFADAMRLEYRGAQYAVAGTQAEQAMLGARRYLLAMLKDFDEDDAGKIPQLDDNDYEAEDVPVGDDAAFWLIGRDPNKVTVADKATFGLIDEGSRLNLNTATLAMLEALPNMTADAAAAIIDWRDSDQDISDYGAEDETYLRLNPAYRTKNADFESVDELRLVHGIDLDLLVGEDANHNGILDSNENDGDASPPNDNKDGKLDPGLLEYLTVWSREPNKSSDGTARTNVIGASESSIQSALTDGLGDSRAQEVARTVAPQLSSIKSVLEFYLISGLTADEFAKVEDKLSDSSDEIIKGRVNVNTAPEAVLACIPGIGTDNAASLVSYRQTKTNDALESIAWVSQVLDAANAKEAGPYLTVRSYVFSADVVALGHNHQGFRRNLFVIDTAESRPKVVYSRDLSRWGWPLGQTLQEEESQQ